MNRYLNSTIRPISRNWLDTNTNGRKKSSVDFYANLTKAARRMQEKEMIKKGYAQIGVATAVNPVLGALVAIGTIAWLAYTAYSSYKQNKLLGAQNQIVADQNRILSDLGKAKLQMQSELQHSLLNKFLPAVPTAAIGAALGGLTGGLYTSMKPKEERTNKPAMLGTLLGGLAGLGYGMLQNKNLTI